MGAFLSIPDDPGDRLFEFQIGCAPYLALFTNWMQSPWFLKVVPSERTVRVHPPFLH